MQIQMKMRAGDAAGYAAHEQAPALSCCPAAAQEACCGPAEKAACCGTVAAAGGGCGCQ